MKKGSKFILALVIVGGSALIKYYAGFELYVFATLSVILYHLFMNSNER